jgi:hypothetical protein
MTFLTAGRAHAKNYLLTPGHGQCAIDCTLLLCRQETKMPIQNPMISLKQGLYGPIDTQIGLWQQGFPHMPPKPILYAEYRHKY